MKRNTNTARAPDHGTAGRLIDLMDRQGRERLDLNGVGTLVLDEADEMLKMGFQASVLLYAMLHIDAHVTRPGFQAFRAVS